MDLKDIAEILARIEDRLDRIEDRLGQVEDRLGQVEDRLGRVEDRLDRIEATHGAQLKEIAEGIAAMRDNDNALLAAIEESARRLDRLEAQA